MRKLILPPLLVSALLFSASDLRADHHNKKLYPELVAPVLMAKCAGCHGEEKQKGKLRVDTLEAIIKGGSEGESVIPGKVDDSSLIQRVYLPLDDDEHMPPEDKEQLTEQETAVLAFWIQSGAKADATIGSLKPDEKTSAAIAHVIGNLPKPEKAVAKADAPKRDEATEKLVTETIGRVEKSGASLMSIAQDTPELRFSALNVAKEFQDNGLAPLQPIATEIKWMDLGRTQITDKGLEKLKGMKSLTRLHLENTKVTDAGLEHLKGLENLEYLNLYGTQVTDAGIQKLAGLKNLKKLFLWQSKATEQGAQKLVAAIPGLDVNIGWKAAAPVEVSAKEEKKPAPKPAPKPEPKPAPKPEPKPAPKPEPKPAPKPEPKPAPKPEPKPAPKPEAKPAPKPAAAVDPKFDKAIAELKSTADQAAKKAADSKKAFSDAIQQVEAATKKAEALKAEAEKAQKVATETKAALDQLMKAAAASQK